jgi:hypothetical protein
MSIKELTARQRRVLPFMVACKSLRDASRASGIRLATIHKWSRNPTFRAELEQMKDAVVGDVVAKLKTNCMKATDVLVGLMDSQSEQVKRGAANDIIEHTKSFMQMRELESRLEKLEIAIKGGAEWESQTEKFIDLRRA